MVEGAPLRAASPSAAYLDIETSWDRQVTVVGVHRPGLGTTQLVAPRIDARLLAVALDGAEVLTTFNGACFDLPVLRDRLGVDLSRMLPHRDLLRDCRRHGLKGGLKRVEMLLGIQRDTEGVTGLDAMRLWERWRRARDREALELLLRYNREDCENLVALEDRLSARFGILAPMMKALVLALVAAAAVPASANDAAFFSALNAVRLQVNAASRDAAGAVVRSVSSFDEKDRLLDLTRDSDASIRATAVRSLRIHMGDYRVQQRIAEIAADSSEVAQVRREAVKDLAYLINHSESREKLLDIAKGRGAGDTELRALALKALYNSAPFDYSTRDFLKDTAKRGELELRLGALWGLFQCSQNDYDARATLVDLMRSYNEPLAVRVEALKSLYLGMGQYDVKDKVMDIAKDTNADSSLRFGAVLALSARRNDYDVRSVLEDLSQRGQTLEIRRAAVIAMGDPANGEILSYFHLGFRRYPGGQYVDPLDGE